MSDKIFTVKVTQLENEDRVYQCDVNGHRIKFSYFKDTETNLFNCFVNDKIFKFKLEDSKYLKEQSKKDSLGDMNDAVAPMPGLVDKINVKIGKQTEIIIS